MVAGDREHNPELTIDFGANARFYPTKIVIDANFLDQANHPPPKILSVEGHKDEKMELISVLELGSQNASVVRELGPACAYQKFTIVMNAPSAGDQWIMRLQRVELHGFFVGWWN
jgi:hypothetical protein